jgi:hypothetical protein
MQELTLPLSLGTAQTGLASLLRAQLFDTQTPAQAVTGLLSGGFTEWGLGAYSWHYAAYPDGYEGTVVFTVGGTPLFITGLNAADFQSLTAAAIAAAVAAYLTANAPAVLAALTSAYALTLIRGDTWAQPVTALGSLVGRTKLWFTVKSNESDPDSAAILQIVEGVGLVTLNGAPATAGQGSIVVTDAATGALTLNLAAAASAQLVLASRLYYDLQWLGPAGVTTPRRGVLQVDADITRSVV